MKKLLTLQLFQLLPDVMVEDSDTNVNTIAVIVFMALVVKKKVYVPVKLVILVSSVILLAQKGVLVQTVYLNVNARMKEFVTQKQEHVNVLQEFQGIYVKGVAQKGCLVGDVKGHADVVEQGVIQHLEHVTATQADMVVGVNVSALVGLMVLAVKVNVNVKKDILLAAIRKTEFVNVDQATLDQHAHQFVLKELLE